MQKASPLVSVIMPAYNAERYISEAIESILNQTFKDFEFIIVDDASTDNTWEIVQKYAEMDGRIKKFRNAFNMKLAKTLNYGIQNARGTYIARMDADDISLPERFELQVSFMNSHPDVVVLGGSMIIIDQNGKTIGKRNYYTDDESIRKHIFFFSPFSHPAVFIRKDAFDRTDGYDPYYNPAEDYDLYFKLGRLGKFANLKENLIKYRVISNSMTTGKLRKMELKTLQIRKKYFLEYKGSFLQLVYSLAQFLTIYSLPSSLRIWLFTKLRGLVV